MFQILKMIKIKNLLTCGMLLVAGSVFAQFEPPPGGGGGGGTAKTLVANPDTLTFALPGTGMVNLVANDTSNGSPITTSDFVAGGGDLTALIISDGGLADHLSLDPTTGVLLVNNMTPAGTYNLTYQLCQLGFSCVSASLTVTVTSAPASLVATADSADVWPTDTLVNVLTNDTVNGSAATSSTASVTIVSDGGLTGLSVNSSGQIVVPLSRIYSRRYLPTYKICEVGNLTNCSSTVTLTLDSHATLVATPDLSISIPSSGGSFNLLANDTYNGAAATTSNVQAGFSGLLSAPPSQISISNGNLVVASGIAAGTYNSLKYRICELTTLIPNNDCTLEVAINLTITAAIPLVATADAVSLSPVANLVSVLANDTMGAAIPAALPTIGVTIVSDGGLTGLTVNGSGQLVVPTRSAGTYTPTYKICETANPSNCSGTATVTITALAGPIAVADTAYLTTAGGTFSVLTNDTFNGAAATSSSVVKNSTGGTLTQLTSNGDVIIPSGLAVGAYSGTYSICEATNISNCSPFVNVTVNILATPVATADTATVAVTGGTINILANDTYNGASASTATVMPSIVATTFVGDVALINPSGQLVLASGLPVGSYTVTYKLCTLVLMTNCSANATVSVTVSAAAATMVANADAGSVVAGAGVTFSILNNDTVNGATATAATAAVTNLGALPTGITHNGSGLITVATTVSAGTYSLTYKICEVGNLTNCSATVSVTITVTAAPATLVATADTGFTMVAGTAGTFNILANDTFNGAAATISNVTVTQFSPVTGFSIVNGQLLAATTVTAGSYSVGYYLCQVGNLTNCSSTVFAAVTVTAPVATLVTTADTGSVVAGSGGTVSILTNDTYNGVAATTSNVVASIVTPVTGFSINSSGQLAVATTVTAGSYTVTYKICELTLLTNCSSTTNVSVTVTAPPTASSVGLIANADGITMPVAGGSLNVLTNDKYNNAAVTASAVTLTLTSNGGITGATLSSAGDLFIPVGLSPKAYSLVYTMCLVSSPSTCTTGQVSIIISATVTTAEKKAPSVSGATTSSSLVITTGQSPLSFGTGGATAAGSISDPIVFSGVRASFGDDVGGLTFINLRQSQDIPRFNALIFYSGAGNLNARWVVIQPGDPDPNEFDVVPEDGLTLAQKARRHNYLQVGDRATGYMLATGSYKLLGPDPSRLPKNQLGTYRILLRLDTTGSTRSGAFYIPFITYRIQSDPIVTASAPSDSTTGGTSGSGGSGSTSQVKSRFTANTNVADFSSLGQLDVGANFLEGNGIKTAGFEKKPPSVGFESVNTKEPKAGQAMPVKSPVKFAWDEAKNASVEVWHLEVANGSGSQLLAIARVSKKTDYALAGPLAQSLPRGQELRWRVRGVDKDGNVTATSAWLFFSLSN